MKHDSIEIRMEEYEELIEYKNELEDYKKAFRLLCEYLDDSGICAGCGTACHTDSKIPCSEIMMECYIREARELDE